MVGIPKEEIEGTHGELDLTGHKTDEKNTHRLIKGYDGLDVAYMKFLRYMVTSPLV